MQETFLSHLIELRSRLVRAVATVLAVFALLSFWAGDIYDLLAQPMLHTLPAGTRMIATGVVTPFFVPIKVTLMVAFVICLPVVLYQAWAFVAPGLYAHEKRLALPLVLGAVLFALVGWLIYRLLQRRPAKDTRTPAQVALDDLEQVGAADLVAAGHMKEHAGLVTDALRRYLTTQYGVAAMDRTTAELRSMLRGINMSEKNALCCDDIFSNADLIKFADVHASPSAATRLLDEARTVVVETDAELAALRAAQKQPGNTNPPASNAAAAGA